MVLSGGIMKINVFSSGSAGNCTLVSSGEENILIDVGITKKQIDENLSLHSLTLNDINAVLITHEHVDHIRAFNSIIKYDNIKIYITKGTLDFIFESNRNKPNIYNLLQERLKEGKIVILNRVKDNIFYESFSLINLKIDVIPTFHDARESIGFVINEGLKKLVFITDTGYVHQALYENISNAECYILESNHDPQLVMASSRPYSLKMRILSEHGHMSNEDSMVTLAHVMGDKTKYVMHAHVSQECNLDYIIEKTREKVFYDYALDTSNIEFVILKPYPNDEVEI